MRYEFRGLIFGGAYTWRGLFSEFYGIHFYKRFNLCRNKLMIFFLCFALIIIVPSDSQNSLEIDLTFLKRCHISSAVNLNAKVF